MAKLSIVLDAPQTIEADLSMLREAEMLHPFDLDLEGPSDVPLDLFVEEIQDDAVEPLVMLPINTLSSILCECALGSFSSFSC